MNTITFPSLLSDMLDIDVPNIPITGLALDSRLVKPGDLFFACVGTQSDGRHYIDDAIKRGASAVLAEKNDLIIEQHGNIPMISIPHLSQKIGLIAAKFYHYPSQKMRVVGITGTNGKTSCSHFVAASLHTLHHRCGIMGTLGNGLYGDIKASNLTTPDAITLQKYLADFHEQGAHYTAMEVSSHSIDQSRITGIDYAVGIFTNLTRDHLDYHGTMEKYGNTKKKFFEQNATKISVINADDEFGKKILTELSNSKQMYSYGTEKRSSVYAHDVHLDLTGIRAQIQSPWGKGELQSKLVGKFNLYNLLAVFTTLCLLDIPYEKVLHAMSTLHSVDGRMQTLGGGKKPLVVIDYAHTPDALEKVLTALRQHCKGKLYCVFGCGGDRDRGKRPLMAKMAEQYADYVIVTDDNPRKEDAKRIFNDILAGFDHPEKVSFEHDRAKTIRDVIRAAQPGDCVLIAGKGAETYQIVGEEKFPFSDVEHVKSEL